jgi:hypothetical protein
MVSVQTIIAGMALFACACIAPAQHTHERAKPKSVWKEYRYPADGFTITLPKAPKERAVKRGTAYLLYWEEDAKVVVNLTAGQRGTDCSAWLARARNPFGDKDPGPNPVVTIDGRPALEGDADRNSFQAGYQRQQCFSGRIYSLEAGWPKDKKKPPIVGKIVNSFHLIAAEPK